MQIVSLLIFFTTFILIVFLGLFIFLTFYNKRARSTIDKFILQASGLRPTVFQNIKLRYTEKSGLKNYIYPNNHCDLYLFDNYLAIIRKQNFGFKIFFAPVMLTCDITTTKKIFDYLKIYKPNKIIFKQNIKGEIDIKLSDDTFKHYSIDITLKGLTTEQTNQLEKIKAFC